MSTNPLPIQIAFPDAADLQLRISVGACRLQIKPGDGSDWVSGSYDDPSNALPLRIEHQGNTVRIAQSFTWPEVWSKVDRPPAFDLKLGKGQPFALSLDVGANEGGIDLGGLPLTKLVINHGAGKMMIDFSAPNPQPMERITLNAGAAGVDMTNLANANFAEMTVEGGAAAYKFEYGGVLQNNASVRISTGMSSTVISVPSATAVRITTQTVLGSVEVGDGFMKKEGGYWNEAALAGKTPALAIAASVAMGSIRLVAI